MMIIIFWRQSCRQILEYTLFFIYIFYKCILFIYSLYIYNYDYYYYNLTQKRNLCISGVSFGLNIWYFHVGWTSSTNTNAKSVSWDKPNVCVFVRVQIFSNPALSEVESVLSRHALSKSCRLLNAQKMKKLKETTGEECLWQWGEKSKEGHGTWEIREVVRRDGRKDDGSMRRR